MPNRESLKHETAIARLNTVQNKLKFFALIKFISYSCNKRGGGGLSVSGHYTQVRRVSCVTHARFPTIDAGSRKPSFVLLTEGLTPVLITRQ